MPTVSLNSFIGKGVYANKTTKAYTAKKDPSKPGYLLMQNGVYIPEVYATYKKGDYLGTLDSWISKPFYYGLENKLLLVFRNNNYNYNTHEVVATDVFDLATNKEIAQQIIAEEDAKKKALEDASKTTMQLYIEKYAPWVIGALVVSIAMPTVVNSVRSRSVGAMGKDSKALVAVSAIILIASLKKKKKRTSSVVIEPAEDITDWHTYEEPKQLIHVSSMPVDSVMSGLNNAKYGRRETPYTC